MKKHVLVADDEPAFVKKLTVLLNDHFTLDILNGCEEVPDALQNFLPDALFLNIGTGSKSAAGLEILKSIKQIDPYLVVFIVDKFNDTKSVLQALHSGADDYFGKSISQSELEVKLELALHRRAKNLEIDYLRKRIAKLKGKFIGGSPIITAIRSQVKNFSSCDNVLITGEIGTGKELVAREIHDQSNRCSKAFVAISSTDVLASSFEQDLFGDQGRTPGKNDSKRPAYLEIADGGTLFFAEVADIPLAIQEKLLYVIHKKAVYRHGTNEPRAIDVRIMAASNRALEILVHKEQFNADLYYCLCTCAIHIPPLREHPEDIPELVQYYLTQFSAITGRQVHNISPMALFALQNFNWPGNVRELSAVIEAAVIRSQFKEIQLHDLQLLSRSAPSPKTDLIHFCYDEAFDYFRHDYFTQLLRDENGNVGAVAKRSGIEQSSLYEIFSRIGIEPDDFKNGKNGA